MLQGFLGKVFGQCWGHEVTLVNVDGRELLLNYLSYPHRHKIVILRVLNYGK